MIVNIIIVIIIKIVLLADIVVAKTIITGLDGSKNASYTSMHNHEKAFHFMNELKLSPKLKMVYNSDNLKDVFAGEYVRGLRTFANLKQLNVLSIGSGSCSIEDSIFRSVSRTLTCTIYIYCYDPSLQGFNASFATSKSRTEKLTRSVQKAYDDGFNFIIPTAKLPEGIVYHGVFAHHSLHHVSDVDGLFQYLSNSMHNDAIFVIADMIGKNGHSRWPEQMEELEKLWPKVPGPVFDYISKCYITIIPNYEYHKCLNKLDSAQEGIKSEDLLPRLVKMFQFERFVAYGGLDFEFVGHRLASNFDPDSSEDKAFLILLHQTQEQALLDGKIKPDQTIATLRTQSYAKGQVKPIVWKHLTPDFCIRDPTLPRESTSPPMDPCIDRCAIDPH